MKIKIWYILEHDGDGTIHPIFMENQGLCDIERKYSHDYWYENTTDYITIDSESPIVVEEVVTVQQYFEDIQKHLNNSFLNKKSKEELKNKYEAIKELME